MTNSTLSDRLWAKVDIKGPDECWEWQGHLDKDGYGAIWINGKDIRAHRASFELAGNTIPEGSLILHSCDNPSCVNPKHLRAGTGSENMSEMTLRGRNKSAKLTLQQVMAIKEDGRIHREIAAEYGVARTTVCNIKAGRFWSKLTGESLAR